MIEFPIVKERFDRHKSIQRRHHVLNGHAVAGFVVENRIDGRGGFNEAIDDEQFRNDIECTARMAAEALGIGISGKKNDAVPDKLDVGDELRFLIRQQPGLGQRKMNWGITVERNRKLHEISPLFAGMM